MCGKALANVQDRVKHIMFMSSAEILEGERENFSPQACVGISRRFCAFWRLPTANFILGEMKMVNGLLPLERKGERGGV